MLNNLVISNNFIIFDKVLTNKNYYNKMDKIILISLIVTGIIVLGAIFYLVCRLFLQMKIEHEYEIKIWKIKPYNLL